MEDMLFPMEMEQSGLVPDGLHVRPGDFEGHDYYDDFARPLDGCLAAAPKPASQCFMSESGLIGEEINWFEESSILPNFLQHDNPYSLPSPHSAANSCEEETPVKSPMEIYQEIKQIEEETSRFPPSEPTSPAREYTTLETVAPAMMDTISDTSSTADRHVEIHAAPDMKYIDSVARSETVEPACLASPEIRHLGSIELSSIFAAQEPFLGSENEDTMDALEMAGFAQGEVSGAPVVQAVHVAQLVGNQLILPDGTQVMVVSSESLAGLGIDLQDAGLSPAPVGEVPEGSPASGSEAQSPAPPPKKVYQKGGYERKKKQNRESACRYRIKKREEKEKQKGEYMQISTRNKELKTQVSGLQQEIEYWQKFMQDVQLRG